MRAIRIGHVRAFCILALLALCVTGRATAQDATFSDAELDQMLAPIALHPDALLSQVLMASTYPLDVGEAAAWSAANPGQEGDAAIAAVESEPWDPAVKSLVAFPQVLAMMGENPEWVQDLGDAFLADPESVMDRIQLLRSKAEQEGNLESTEQQTVSHQATGPSVDVSEDPGTQSAVTGSAESEADTTAVESQSAVETSAEEPSSEQTIVVEQAPTQTIIIEQADPQVVYVPSYDPTIIYGVWWWPAYRPWYWRPVGWGFGGAVVRGIGFGIGVGITNSLWGGFNWGRRDIDIDVNRYNNININNRISSNDRRVGWKHDPDRRRGTPYRDSRTREQYSQRRDGGERVDGYRGRGVRDDAQRDASRERARQTLSDRGADPAKSREQLRDDPQTRERAQRAAQRDSASSANRQARAGDRGAGGGSAQNAGRSQERADRQRAEQTRARETAKNRDRDSALRGAGNSKHTRRDANRGKASRVSARSGGHRGGGRR